MPGLPQSGVTSSYTSTTQHKKNKESFKKCNHASTARCFRLCFLESRRLYFAVPLTLKFWLLPWLLASLFFLPTCLNSPPYFCGVLYLRVRRFKRFATAGPSAINVDATKQNHQIACAWALIWLRSEAAGDDFPHWQIAARESRARAGSECLEMCFFGSAPLDRWYRPFPDEIHYHAETENIHFG